MFKSIRAEPPLLAKVYGNFRLSHAVAECQRVRLGMSVRRNRHDRVLTSNSAYRCFRPMSAHPSTKTVETTRVSD